MTDFSKDQTYVEWFLRNKRIIKKERERNEEEEKPTSSPNFSVSI